MSNVTDEYYASDAFVGYGAQFKVGQGDSPETFVAVPEINKIGNVVKGSTGIIDVTHLRSPNRHKEKLATLRDSAAIQIDGNFLPGHGAHKLAGGDGFVSGHSLFALWKSCAKNNFEIVLPDAAGLVGSPAADIVLPLVGTITAYEVGEMTPEGKVPFMMQVTPLHDYYTN